MVKSIASDPTHEEIQAALSHPDASYEIVDGQIVEKPAMGVYARWIGLMLYESLQ